jgi:kynureninase
MTFENTKEFARQLDSEDKLNKYRDEFIFPKVNDKKVIYFTGIHCLQPKERAYVDEVDDWANLAVEGHFMLKSLGGIITSV